MADVGAILSERLMTAAQVVEEQLDAELNKMEKLDEDDLEAIRRQRLANLEKAQAQKREWLKQGHGEYCEISEEKEFFNVTKNSENVVCQFYRPETFRCKIFDKHLNILAKKHVETKFCKINAEKCPFLVERLRVKVIPTLLLVQGAKTKDYIVGFTELGNTDEFSTAMLEWRLARSDIINYSGDLLTPPDAGKSARTAIIKKQQSKTIRGGPNRDESSDEDDW